MQIAALAVAMVGVSAAVSGPSQASAVEKSPDLVGDLRLLRAAGGCGLGRLARHVGPLPRHPPSRSASRARKQAVALEAALRLLVPDLSAH